MTFQVKKKLDLSYLGDGWTQGTYLNFSSLTFAETREFANLNVDTENTDNTANQQSLDMVLGIVTKHFIDGMGWDGQKLAEISASDIQDLPVEVVTKSIQLLVGTTDPKS